MVTAELKLGSRGGPTMKEVLAHGLALLLLAIVHARAA